jgi:hypothetical protein
VYKNGTNDKNTIEWERKMIHFHTFSQEGYNTVYNTITQKPESQRTIRTSNKIRNLSLTSSAATNTISSEFRNSLV